MYWINLGKSKTGGTTGINIGTHFFFLIYINDMPKLATIGTKILLYADDTSIIVTTQNLENFETQIDKMVGDINNWFKINQLVFNYNKHITYNSIRKIVGIMIWNLTTRVIMSKALQIQNFWVWSPMISYCGSLTPNDFQIEFSMLCNPDRTSYNVSRS